MYVVKMDDHLARVERAVRSNLNNATPLAVVEVERHERKGYWERAYIVAWQNEREFGTHRVCIDSKGESACMWGHYLKAKGEAVTDLLDRANLNAEVDRLRSEWRKADDGWIACRDELAKALGQTGDNPADPTWTRVSYEEGNDA